MKVEVKRTSDNGTQTLGEMVVWDNGKILFNCFTLELPWKNNLKRKSCIPKGSYKCILVGATANIPYEHPLILNVPNRDGVCIHKANYHTQLLGCVGVGKKLIDINKDGEKDTVSSGETFDKLMSILPVEFDLNIV